MIIFSKKFVSFWVKYKCKKYGNFNFKEHTKVKGRPYLYEAWYVELYVLNLLEMNIFTGQLYFFSVHIFSDRNTRRLH